MLTVSIATRPCPPGAARGREVNAWHDEQGAVFARGFAREGAFGVDWPGLAYFECTAGSTRVETWLADPARRAAAEDAVSRVLQPMLLQALGWQALHASANVIDGRVVAFCGRSGHGKSTLARAVAHRGAAQFADDAVLLDFSRGAPMAHPLPFRSRLRPPALEHFGASPDRDARREPAALGLIVILEQDAGRSVPAFGRVPGVQAFAAVVTHAHCFDPAPGPGTERLVKDYMTLSAAVPVLRLHYPPGLDTVDALAARTIDVARTAGRAGPRPAGAAE